jgi:hypothetical protein
MEPMIQRRCLKRNDFVPTRPLPQVRLKVGEKKRWSGLEFRIPKSEPRNPKEIRNPNAALEPFQLNSQSDLRKTA